MKLKSMALGVVVACVVLVFAVYALANYGSGGLKNSASTESTPQLSGILKINTAANSSPQPTSALKNSVIAASAPKPTAGSSGSNKVPTESVYNVLYPSTGSPDITDNTAGETTTTGNDQNPSGNQADTKRGKIYVNVLMPGNPPKIITDAKVTLLKFINDSRTRAYQASEIVDTSDNPLLQANDVAAGGPAYSFSNVLYNPGDNSWFYMAVVEKDGHVIEMPAGFSEVSGIFYDNGWGTAPEGLTDNTLYGFLQYYDPGANKNQAVPGVKVSLYRCTGYDQTGKNTNLGSAGTCDSSQTGLFRFDGLQPGYYDLTVEKDGLKDNSVVNFTGGELSKYQINYLVLH